MLSPEAYRRVLRKLAKAYPNAQTELVYRNPFELLIATILSAQCTDKRVNMVTPTLFQALPTPQAMLAAGYDALAGFVKTCGLYQSKARNILKTCALLLNEFDGEVPKNIDDLQRLPGVGRKTANVVVSQAFGVPAIAVDTHVFRVANRLGLAHAKTVEATEQQLMAAIPRRSWSEAHHWLILHGRRVCHARKPDCPNCVLKPECRFYQQHEIVIQK